MRNIVVLLVLSVVSVPAFSQYINIVKGDSVYVLKPGDSAELIIENHSQGIRGFLYNKGKGRTQFRKLLTRLDSSGYSWLVGADTLTINASGIWAGNGSAIYSTNAGNVGIQRNNPAYMLDLPGSTNIDDSSSYGIRETPLLYLRNKDANGLYEVNIGSNITSGSHGERNVKIGQSVCSFGVFKGADNSFMGWGSGAATLYDDSVIVHGKSSYLGGQCGWENSAGERTCLGQFSGGFGVWYIPASYDGSFVNTGCSSLGFYSGVSQFAKHSVFAGDSAGYYKLNSYNTFIGPNAADSGVGLSYALALGARADIWQEEYVVAYQLDDCAAIGYHAIDHKYLKTMVFGDTQVNSWLFNSNAASNSSAALIVGSNAGNGNGAYLSNTGVWTNASDYFKKEDFTDLRDSEILNKLAALPISKWNYKGLSDKHIGPVAQDFHQIFGLGTDDKTISTIDPSGIALAAIKALRHKQVSAAMTAEKQNTGLNDLSVLLAKQDEKLQQLSVELERQADERKRHEQRLKSLMERMQEN